MQITEHGRHTVSTTKFAEQLRDMTVALKSVGESDESGKSLILCFVACVLTDTPPPDWLTDDPRQLSSSEQMEFQEFRALVDEHVEDLNRVFASALEKLVEQDAGGHA